MALLLFAAVLYRESIIIGETSMSREEVHELVQKMGEEYKGNLYHLLQRNCNHFSEDFAYRLCQAKTPNWVCAKHNSNFSSFMLLQLIGCIVYLLLL